MELDVNKAMEQLADGLGVAVDNLYPILYKQAIIDAVIESLYLVGSISFIVGFVFTLRYISRKQKEDRYDYEWDWDEPSQLIIVTAGSLVSVILLITIPFSINTILTALFNTEYYMIKEVLNQIK